ncbi:MAG: TIGR03000 domain-containing protein, partial [Planctomycetota bacterium]
HDGGYYDGGDGRYYGPPAQMPPPAREGEKLKTPPKSGTEEASLSAPARIRVTLPAEAKLMIDDFVTTSTSSTRVFALPSLERGQVFYYTLKGELLRDGQTLTSTKKVPVRAGQETQVQLDFASVVVAQK